MKKGKVFTKGQIAVFLMVLALGGAVFLNVKYSGNDKFLGQATYVSKSGSTDSKKTVATSAKVSSGDYFTTALKERDAAIEKASEQAEEVLRRANLTDNEKQEALKTVKSLSNRVATAQNIETLVKAKGFKNAVAVISDSSLTVIVKGEKLSDTQTMQIQDIVLSNTDFKLDAVKIMTVK